LESDDISFVRGVGTTVADSAGEGMTEAANVEDAVEVAFGLVDDAVEDEATWAELADDTASRPRLRVCIMMVGDKS
jgi:hypothetical protein